MIYKLIFFGLSPLKPPTTARPDKSVEPFTMNRSQEMQEIDQLNYSGL